MNCYTFTLDGVATQIPQHFQEHEFQGWFEVVDPELIARINLFREYLGYPVAVSPASGAVGREQDNSYSRHNIERYGRVMAVDLMPSKHEPDRWYEAAKSVGLTGFGYYPDWRPSAGCHVDVGRGLTKMATWGAVRDCPSCRQRYVSLSHALRKGRGRKKRS